MPNIYDGTYLRKGFELEALTVFAKKRHLICLREFSFRLVSCIFLIHCKYSYMKIQNKCSLSKATPTQVLPCKSFKNAFFYRATPVAAFYDKQQ